MAKVTLNNKMELNIPCECVLLEHFVFFKTKNWDFLKCEFN